MPKKNPAPGHYRFSGRRGRVGRPILVTGAGGYIGSALAKSIAAAGPASLVLLDSSEQNLFEIHRHLDEAHARVPHEAILGSVADASLLNGIFRRFSPSIVYHDAALKHVPLLELNPMAAVRNNAVGTYTLAEAARHHGVSKLVLVSTDKAVNPHSIMGASKRLAELTVAALSGPACRMNAVRLGNVLGSSGSVVPIFLEQISRGGPVTVTHPEVSRYFMCLHDAVEAILAAGAADCSGKILLPDLGEPQRITDLARVLAPHVSTQIIGLRPGEKIAEDLVYRTEIRERSGRGPLDVIRTPSPAPAELHGFMAQLGCLLAAGDLPGVIGAICAMVPEYQPSSAIRSACA
jgi:FlaA1/EpsC-like NDP-sugar epimerase